MRKLIPLMLFTFCGTVAFSQSSPDKSSDSKDNIFAESLRQEIIGGIKKKLATDTSFQKSQQVFNEYYKACGLQMTVKNCEHSSPAKTYAVAPESIALILRKDQ